KENAAQRRGIHAESQIKPICGETLHNEAAAKRVKREKAGELEHDGARVPDAKQGSHPLRSLWIATGFGGGRKAVEEECEQEAQRRIENDDGPLAGKRRHCGLL